MGINYPKELDALSRRTSSNAVLTQVWVAMGYYLLLTYIKYQTK